MKYKKLHSGKLSNSKFPTTRLWASCGEGEELSEN